MLFGFPSLLSELPSLAQQRLQSTQAVERRRLPAATAVQPWIRKCFLAAPQAAAGFCLRLTGTAVARVFMAFTHTDVPVRSAAISHLRGRTVASAEAEPGTASSAAPASFLALPRSTESESQNSALAEAAESVSTWQHGRSRANTKSSRDSSGSGRRKRAGSRSLTRNVKQEVSDAGSCSSGKI